MPTPEARELAFRLLANPEWFETSPATGAPDASLPPTARDLFAKYAAMRGRFLDLRLDHADIGHSSVLPELLRLGYDDAHVELCCRGAIDTVLKVATDVGPDDAVEAELPSLFHAIVHAAAVVEYVSPPDAAV